MLTAVKILPVWRILDLPQGFSPATYIQAYTSTSYLSINIFIHLSIQLLIYSFFSLSIYSFFSLSIYSFFSLSINPPIYLSIYLYIHLSIYPSIHLSIYPSFYLYIYLSIVETRDKQTSLVHLKLTQTSKIYCALPIDSY